MKVIFLVLKYMTSIWLIEYKDYKKIWINKHFLIIF